MVSFNPYCCICWYYLLKPKNKAPYIPQFNWVQKKIDRSPHPVLTWKAIAYTLLTSKKNGIYKQYSEIRGPQFSHNVTSIIFTHQPTLDLHSLTFPRSRPKFIPRAWGEVREDVWGLSPSRRMKNMNGRSLLYHPYSLKKVPQETPQLQVWVFYGSKAGIQKTLSMQMDNYLLLASICVATTPWE
jgi:hypothetical protein